MPLLTIRFELEGNDFPIIFFYDQNQRSARIFHDNDWSEQKGIDSYHDLMNFINYNFISITEEHDREYLEADIYFSNLLNDCNYFIVGRDYRVTEARKD